MAKRIMGNDNAASTCGSPGNLRGMAQPPFVPQSGPHVVRHYSSPPRRARSWWANRPGELPTGARDEVAGNSGEGSVGDFGGASAHQGPDQGYALLLAARFAPHLRLSPEESLNDVIAGCVAVALKRASLLGRAPIAEDLRIAFTHWGYLASDAEPPGAEPAEGTSARRAELFAGASSHEGRTVRRRIAESVSQTDLLVPSFARP